MTSGPSTQPTPAGTASAAGTPGQIARRITDELEAGLPEDLSLVAGVGADQD